MEIFEIISFQINVGTVIPGFCQSWLLFNRKLPEVTEEDTHHFVVEACFGFVERLFVEQKFFGWSQWITNCLPKDLVTFRRGPQAYGHRQDTQKWQVTHDYTLITDFMQMISFVSIKSRLRPLFRQKTFDGDWITWTYKGSMDLVNRWPLITCGRHWDNRNWIRLSQRRNWLKINKTL